MGQGQARFSIQGYRRGFLFVVLLLVGVAVFTLYGEVKTNERVDALVGQGLERAGLIATIRVAALQLEQAIDQHIRAGSDERRREADQEMAYILEQIKLSSDLYTQDLPPGEVELWKTFYGTSQLLVNQVRTAVRYSNRKQAERARQHLEEEIRPVMWELEELAGALARKNKEETQLLLRRLEDLRLRTTLAGAGAAGLAVLVALLVGRRVVVVMRRQERTIDDQLAELARRNQELDAFASRVAHDLISPLAPLKGYLTLIRRATAQTTNDPSVREMLESAENSAARMTELIEALLRFCRAGNPSEPTVSELDTAVSSLLLEVSQTAARSGVRLERHLEPSIRVPCSQQLLQSIAQNLLSNAVKYSAGRPDATVSVRVVRERATAVLEVTDNGIGMSEESQRQLFQPFFRAPEARGLPGHGLGMATTRRLVEAHAGTIAVKSAPGAGTQVVVRLPLASGGSTPPSRPPLVLEGELAGGTPTR